MAARHWFVVPDLAGPPSGGTLYNREVLRELGDRRFPAAALSLEQAVSALAAGTDGMFWIDTMFLDDLSRLRAANLRDRPLALLMHYLPSLVTHGDTLAATELGADEALALRTSHAFLVPSETLRDRLRSWHVTAPISLVKPGAFAPKIADLPPTTTSLRAAIVAHLNPGKGVEPFLRALQEATESTDDFEIDIVGRHDADSAYAERCVGLVQSSTSLRERVRFSGGLSPEQVVANLSTKNLLISASRMESYGMAVAEARTLGVPVLGRRGGHVAELVDHVAGGELCDDERELAHACVRLARNPRELRTRLDAARNHPLPPRPWSQAATELGIQLLAIAEALEK